MKVYVVLEIYYNPDRSCDTNVACVTTSAAYAKKISDELSVLPHTISDVVEQELM